MSEKIYALLLRLHSSRFLRAYGEDALQLFRDRARHERGFAAHLRLWLDLLADLAISVPRGYIAMKPHLAAGAMPAELGGAPSFRLLTQKPLNRWALVLAVAMSLILVKVLLWDTSALPVDIVDLMVHGDTSWPLAGHQRLPIAHGPGPNRNALERDNCTFGKVAILQHTIGYLKLNSFPSPSICEASARASMTSLNDTDAILFDLRDMLAETRKW
jgi:hypothetical protein